MNVKKNLVKPKPDPKITSSPDPHLRTQITHTNTNPNSQQMLSPASKIRPLAIKKSQPLRQPQPSKIKLIIQAQAASNSDSELVGSDISKQDLLLLQIKHLKRQNTFLKKKLQQLTAQHEGYHPRRKVASKAKGYQAPIIQSLHLNVKHFFKQINNLLASITKLFKLNLNEEDSPVSIKTIEVDTEQCPIQREFLFKKYMLNRRLEKIALQDQDRRYPALLSIFTEYYRYKEEAERKILQTLDAMIVKTNDLNKWLLQKAQIKKMRSEDYCLSQKQSIASPQKATNHQFPKPQLHSNRMTFSPNPKYIPYKRGTDLSP